MQTLRRKKRRFVKKALFSAETLRKHNVSDICEMKHSVSTFSIDNDYAKDLQNKLDAYRELSKDKRTLHLVMVTTNGVAHNNYYNMVQKEIIMDDLFAM